MKEPASRAQRQLVKQTDLQGTDRAQLKVKQFISCFFFEPTAFPCYLTNTPHPGKPPSPDCHMWFQSANQALRLQGSFRQVSL